MLASPRGSGQRRGRLEALRVGRGAALVSLDFAAGRLTAILGPSGCGKTTLLRSIAGFVSVDAGAIRFDGDDVTALPPQQRGTAMVFQSYALWPHMTVFDNVAYGLRLKRVPARGDRAPGAEALALVEIGDVEAIARRKPAALSGGQQQRVALARAIVVEPRVLLLDEPLSNLDAKIRQRLRVEVRRLQRRVGITTIYVTHDQEEALAIADHVVLMKRGVVVQAGTPEQVYLEPATEFVADFLGVGNASRGPRRVGRAARSKASACRTAAGARAACSVILRSSDLDLAAAGGGRRPRRHPGREPVPRRVLPSLRAGGRRRAHGGRCLLRRPPGPVTITVPPDACACTRRPDERRVHMLLAALLAVLLALVVPASAATRLNVAIGADVNVVEVHKTLLGPGLPRQAPDVEINVVGTGTGEPASRAIYTKIKAQADTGRKPWDIDVALVSMAVASQMVKEGLLHRYVPQMKNAALVKGAEVKEAFGVTSTATWCRCSTTRSRSPTTRPRWRRRRSPSTSSPRG